MKKRVLTGIIVLFFVLPLILIGTACYDKLIHN